MLSYGHMFYCKKLIQNTRKMFEISSCSYLTVLPDPAWVLLSNKYILFPGALYGIIQSFKFQGWLVT